MRKPYLLCVPFVAAALTSYALQAQTTAPPSSTGAVGTSARPDVTGSVGQPRTDQSLSATVNGLPGTLPIVTSGKSAGYDVTVSGGDYGTVNVELSKSGKTQDEYGLLRKKWDERETLSLSYVPTIDGKWRLVRSRRIVEQKAPVGPWRTVTDNDEVPKELSASAGATAPGSNKSIQ